MFVQEIGTHLLDCTVSNRTDMCIIYFRMLEVSKIVCVFGGLVVSMLASGAQDHGFEPDRSRRIFWAKYPQHAFLRRGSKAVCPMSQICGM
jgi:uncharacterized protein (DUF1786 family)